MAARLYLEHDRGKKVNIRFFKTRNEFVFIVSLDAGFQGKMLVDRGGDGDVGIKPVSFEIPQVQK